MAAIVYIKSVLWLAAFGGLGYGLLELTKPSQEKISKIKEYSTGYLTENEKRKLLFMQKLKEAGTDTPIYMKKEKDSETK